MKARVNGGTDNDSLKHSHKSLELLQLTDPHHIHMVIKPFLLLGLAAEYRCRQWMWSILLPTIRHLWHSLANLSWQRPRRSSVDFYSKINEKIAWATLLGDLGVTYALQLQLVGKPVVDFIIVVIELFSLSPTVETLWAEIGGSWRFSERWVTSSTDFRGNGALPHQPLLASEK